MRQHRLDPTKPPMWAAVDWMLDRGDAAGLDLSRTLVVTPGARAGRILITLLAKACQEGRRLFVPPQTATAGRLAEALAPSPRAAGSAHQTLAWRAVLAEAPADTLAAVLPETDEPSAWADEIARTAEELARGGLRCGDVASAELPPMEEPARWSAMALLQERYESVLEAADLVDPWLHAMDAAAAGDGYDAVVLLSCTDLGPLARAMLGRVSCPVHVLSALDEGLHEDGVVDDSYWREAAIEIDPQSVFVTTGPEAQGAMALRAAIDLQTTAIGTGDEGLAGAVRRAAHAHGLDVHVAWGRPASTSGVGNLLGDLAVLLRDRSFVALDRVLRCPAVLASLEAQHASYAQLPAAMDDYLDAALPTRAFGRLPPGSERAHRAFKLVRGAQRWLRGTIAPLRAAPRTLRAWAPAIEEAIVGLLGPGEERLAEGSLEAIEAVGQELRTLADLPEALDGHAVSAHEALAFLRGRLAEHAGAPEPGGEALDVLGWLELPLDPSEAMVIMGMHDDVLPARRSPSPLFTEGLRRALGLPGEDRTLARDAASLRILQGGGRTLRFVLGTTGIGGDPVLPSTLLLRGSGDNPAMVLERVAHAFETPPAKPAQPACGYRVGVINEVPQIDRMAVTSFRTFLQSPYLFYLQHMLRLREISPAPPVVRLEANGFGTLIHAALRDFAGDPSMRQTSDEAEIRRMLLACLWDATDKLAGKARSATLLAQLDAAERRMGMFAAFEAARRDAGWRTIAVEWSPEGGVALPGSDVRLTGSIDRIDRHEDSGQLALLDYKTSDRAKSPSSTHRRRDKSWRDLQLPLYEVLAMPLATEQACESPPTLGYIALASEQATEMDSGWEEEDRADAISCAQDVVRSIRRGAEALAELGTPTYESALTRLAGLGLLLDDEHRDAEAVRS